ncbi:T9SS type A sorting domain-containing protein [Lewinella cohaerens]|uniref:T9SS type A sorting domain-containing protein n=1 Tax=Lewinella cohaerens TaxID=70995 RepID=UPI00037D3768|nr:T9SS type A sorting domain-containing protein [Lewinella cohaerens]
MKKNINRFGRYCSQSCIPFQRSFLVLFFLAATLQLSAQLATWDFEGETTAATSMATNVTATAAVFGPNVGNVSFPSGNGSTDSYSGNNWPTGGIAADRYLEVIVEADPCFTLNVTGISFDERRSGTGPATLFVIWSTVDAFVPNSGYGGSVDTPIPDNTSWRTQTFMQPLSNSKIIFRIFGYNAEGSTGTWRFDNIEIQGTVIENTEAPEVTCADFTETFSYCAGFLGPNTITTPTWILVGADGEIGSTAGGIFSQTADVSACISDNDTDLADIEYSTIASYEEDRTDCSLTIVNEYAFRDACGNVADETVLVKFLFEDPGVDPTITTCPADLIVECGMPTDPSATGTATADDDCPAAPIVGFSDSFDPSCGSGTGLITRTWTATDECGGTASCVQFINIVDTTPPNVSCAEFTTFFDGGCSATLSPNVPSGGFGPIPADGMINVGIGIGTGASFELDLNGCVSDDCTDGFNGLGIRLVSSTIGNAACGQTLTNTYDIQDACGNISTDLVTIVATFGDTDGPEVTCADFTATFDNCPDGFGPNTPNGEWQDVPDDGTFLAASGGIFSVEVDLNGCVTDNCSDLTDLEWTLVDSYSEDFVAGCSITLVNEIAIRDACGNVSDDIITTKITITNENSTTPPNIVCPGNTTVECGNSTDPADTGTATATTDCGMATITFSDNFDPGGCGSGTGVIARTWTATSPCGITSTCVQSITIVDNLPPSFVSFPSDTNVECGDSTDPADTGTPSASDFCGTAAITFSDSFDDSCGNTGTINRTWAATDGCGNSTSQLQTITIVDNTPPVLALNCTTFAETFEGCPRFIGPNVPGASFTLSSNGTFLSAAGGSFITEVDLNNCVTEACGDLANLLLTVVASYEENTTACSTTIINEYSLTDECGNVAETNLFVRITIENTSNAVIVCPANADLTCGDSTDPMDTGMATATDQCGDVDVTFSDEITMRCNNGAYAIIRTWTAEGCGEPTSCQQLIVLSDEEAPMFDLACQVDQTFTTEDGDLCPADATISLTEGDELTTSDSWTVGGNAVPSLAGCVSDNCALDEEIIITVDDITVSGSGTCMRTIAVTFIADDGCGNDSEPFTLNYTFLDDTEPVFDLACQIDQTYFTEDGNVCPADATISLNEGDEIDVFTGWTVGGVAILPLQGCVDDNCADEADLIITVDDITVVDDGTCSRVITVTFIADDGCGNLSDPFVCNYTFIDDTGPEVSFNGIPDGGTYVVECDLPSTTWDPLIDIGELTITDNCSAIDFAGITEVLTQLYDGPCTGNLLTRWQQVFTVQDVCGNTTVYTLFTEIIDTTPPVFEDSPADVTIECDQTAAMPEMEAFDSCSEVIYNFNEVRTDGDCPNNYTLTRTWLASDGCGNTSVETQIVTVEDTTPPVIEFVDEYVSAYTPGQDVFIECSEYGNISLIIASAAAAFDNCSGGVPTSYDLQDLGGFDCAEYGYSGHLISTWKAADECGNESVATINWFLVDETAPVFQGLPADACAPLDNLPPVADVQAVDDCELATLTFSQSDPIDCDGGQYIERTWSAEDACGNTNSYTQRISLNGTSGPTITIDYPEIGDVMDGDLIQLPIDCDQDIAFSAAALEDAISVGSGCGSGESSIELNLMDEGDCLEDGYFARYRLSVTATDACGNTTSLGIMIDFVDMTPPVVSSPNELTLNCGDDIPMIEATDACGEIASMTFVDSAPIEVSCSANPVAYDRTWTVTDACGNAMTFTQSIIVLDNDGPVFSGVPADMCNNTGIDVVVTAVDDCTGNQAQVFLEEVMSSESGCGEVLTRTWTATDACGNTSTATQQVFFDDNEAPEIEFTSDLLFGLESGDELFLTVGDGFGDPSDPLLLTADDVTVTDNCATITAAVLVESTTSGDCAADGYIAQYDYKFIATDPCGNTSSAAITVFYVDGNAPDFFNIPADIEVFCTAIPPVADVTASDDYDEAVEVIFSETQTATPDGVLITRTWTATDKCGNTNAVSQEILVVNNDIDATFSFGSSVIECNSDNNRLGVTPTGGTPPYSYEWQLTFPLEDGYITTDPTLPGILFTMGYITQTFTVLITDANGCEYAASVTVVCDYSGEEGDFTGNGNNGAIKLNVYPNPVNDLLQVKADGLEDTPVTVALYNLFGQELSRTEVDTWTQEGLTIDTRRFPNGTYLLRLTADGHEVQTREVVILH